MKKLDKEKSKMVMFGGGSQCFTCNKFYRYDELDNNKIKKCPKCGNKLVPQR